VTALFVEMGNVVSPSGMSFAVFHELEQPHMLGLAENPLVLLLPHGLAA
jgi:hypothetical protein